MLLFTSNFKPLYAELYILGKTGRGAGGGEDQWVKLGHGNWEIDRKCLVHKASGY